MKDSKKVKSVSTAFGVKGEKGEPLALGADKTELSGSLELLKIQVASGFHCFLGKFVSILKEAWFQVLLIKLIGRWSLTEMIGVAQ